MSAPIPVINSENYSKLKSFGKRNFILQLIDPIQDTCSVSIGPVANGVSFEISFGRAGDTQPFERENKKRYIVNNPLLFGTKKRIWFENKQN